MFLVQRGRAHLQLDHDPWGPSIYRHYMHSKEADVTGVAFATPLITICALPDEHYGSLPNSHYCGKLWQEQEQSGCPRMEAMPLPKSRQVGALFRGGDAGGIEMQSGWYVSVLQLVAQ